MRRHLTTLTMTTMALLGVAVVFTPVDLFSQQTPRPILVTEVTSVDLTVEKSNPPAALLKARGKVPTGGHTNPRLEPVFSAPPPSDGIQEYNFLVDPPRPGTVVTQVITEVETPVLRIAPVPSGLKGFRIRGQTNSIEKPCC